MRSYSPDGDAINQPVYVTRNLSNQCRLLGTFNIAEGTFENIAIEVPPSPMLLEETGASKNARQCKRPNIHPVSCEWRSI